MYALARNAGKDIDRDKRIKKTQHIEYDYLAPDSINEAFTALKLLAKFVAIAKQGGDDNDQEDFLIATGKKILDEKKLGETEVFAYGFENDKRPVKMIKVQQSYDIYKQLIVYYGVSQLVHFIQSNRINSFEKLMEALPAKPQRLEWSNIGGQLIPQNAVDSLLRNIRSGTINGWEEVHDFYRKNGQLYKSQKLEHAFASLLELLQIRKEQFTPLLLKDLMQQFLEIKEWMAKGIHDSRAKDYQNEFRQMVYDNRKEMEEVTGPLEDNVFILQQTEELEAIKNTVESIVERFQLMETETLTTTTDLQE